MADSFFIGGDVKGLQTYTKPFWIHASAYATMENCFTYRDRVRKKVGYLNVGRLRRVFSNVSLTACDGSATYTIADLLTSFRANEPNAEIQPSSVQITLDAGGANETIYTDNGNGTWTYVSGPYTINTATSLINYATGAITFNFTVTPPNLTTVTINYAYYPALPVMGIRRQELTAINQEETIAFDTRYAYSRSGNQWIETPSAVSTTWSGNNYNLFYSNNYFATDSSINVMWATNGLAGLNAYQMTTIAGSVAGPPSTANITTSTTNDFQIGDEIIFINTSGGVASGTTATVTAAGNPFSVSTPGTGVFTNGAFTGSIIANNKGIGQSVSGQNGIRYYDTNGTPSWYGFNPALTSVDLLTGCLLILPFKSRLIALNTIENESGTNVNYRNRVRASVSFPKGTPLGYNAWRTDIPGNGFFLDAPTSEAIIGADLLKDRLIVYFERSTWELVYTGNDTLPFFFRQINRELGAESTFSIVPFDNGILGIGATGIHSCNGVNVERIDLPIIDEVFRIQNLNNGPQRVSGIRDYQLELVYWAFPDFNSYDSDNDSQIFPNRIFVYNYRNNEWAFFDDSFTCYGYFQPATDYTWETLPYATWEDWDETWDSGYYQARNVLVAAGNAQGFIAQMEKESVSNDYFYTCTNIATSGDQIQITSPNHNLKATNPNSFGQENFGDFISFDSVNGISGLNANIPYKVQQIIDANNFLINGTITGTYLGGSQFKRLYNFDLVTKDFNPYQADGKNVRINVIDLLVDRVALPVSNEPLSIAFFVYLNDSNSVPLDPLYGTNDIELTPFSLVPLQSQQQTFWRQKTINAIGQYVQFEMTHTEEQMSNIQNADVTFVLHAMYLKTEKSGRLSPP